jgi:ribose/xylose/arabinose/galactoside ABC-type transport system permease subunit
MYGAPTAYGPPPDYTIPPAYGAPPTYAVPPVRSSPENITFVNSFLGIAVLGALLIISLVSGVLTTPYFFTANNLNNVFKQFCLMGAIALAAAVSVRAKGPDLSIGSVMALSSIIIALNFQDSGSAVPGILLSLFVCAVIGTANGAIITYLRAPALIVTLLTGLMVRGICYLATGATVIQAGDSLRFIAQSVVAGIPVGALVFLIVTFVIAFLTIMLSKLGVPTYKREKKSELSHMFAYTVSALIASLAGLFVLSWFAIAQPALGTGYEPFILLVFACIAGSRALDNHFAPALFALAPALFYTVLNNVLNLLQVNAMAQPIFAGVIALIFVVISYMTRPKTEASGLR